LGDTFARASSDVLTEQWVRDPRSSSPGLGLPQNHLAALV